MPGVGPARYFEPRDGGQRWEERPVEFAAEGVFGGPARVLQMVVDPTDPQIVWAGVEADGIRLSLDGGDSWNDVSAGLFDTDIHGMAISPGAPCMVFASADMEVHTTLDRGQTWQTIGVQKRFVPRNCRHVAVKADDPNVIFVALGGDDISVTGVVQRSKDRGETWEPLSFPIPPNTPIWNFATNPADPDLIVCSTHYGQLFVSTDGGDAWEKFARNSARYGRSPGHPTNCRSQETANRRCRRRGACAPLDEIHRRFDRAPGGGASPDRGDS